MRFENACPKFGVSPPPKNQGPQNHLFSTTGVLEQSTAARHIRAVTASLPHSPQDTSLQTLFQFQWPYCCAWEVAMSYSDTLVVFRSFRKI